MEKYNFSGRQILIINSLYKHGELRAQDLALSLNVSLRTVKYDIKALKSKLRDNTVELKSSSKGYTLEIKDDDFKEYLDTLDSSRKIKAINKINAHNYERIFYIVRRILAIETYIKLDQLAEELYVSLSTMNQDIREVNRF